MVIRHTTASRLTLKLKETSAKRRLGTMEKAIAESLVEDFLAPLTALGLGVHAENLYNDYVYFWRWALWKVIENNKHGIVSFITASSYFRGPGFVAMREYMRKAFDELWIMDLEGDNIGARKTENVFNIQSPVAIAIGVRYAENKENELAKVHYVPSKVRARKN